MKKSTAVPANERTAKSRAKNKNEKEKQTHTKFINAHRNWCKDNNATTEEWFEDLSKKEAYWLVTLPENTYAIIRRSFNKDGRKPTPKIISYENREKALADFEKIKNMDLPPYWSKISEFTNIAHSFLSKYKNQVEDLPASAYSYYPLWDIRFIFALSDHLEFGFSYQDEVLDQEVSEIGSKARIAHRTIQNCKNTKEQLLALFNGLSFEKKNLNGIKDVISRMYTKIATDTDEEGFTTKPTFDFKSKILLGAISNLDKFSVYSNAETIISYAERERLRILEKYTYNEQTDVGTIIPCNNFQAIEIEHLRKILDIAWDYSPKFYNFLILQLTVGLRPEEILRFVKNPMEHLIESKWLNYSSKKLITKTSRKRKRKINDPKLSLVGRMIIFHDSVLPVESQILGPV